MPKITEYPLLRTHTKKGPNGQTWKSYWYDRRSSGLGDLPLGTDFQEALRRWQMVRDGQPLPALPKAAKKQPPPKLPPRPIRLPVLQDGKAQKAHR